MRPVQAPILPERYQVMDRLGQGGMAMVWRALDRTSDTEVAVKVLLPHLRDNEMVVERFRREIAAVRRIDHPGVVQIFDLLETEDVLALVLEYLPGIDLKRTIRRTGALPPAQVIDLGRQLLDTLGAAHAQGVIHRDVKPHNVLLTEDGRAKLTDFGLARVDDLMRVTTHTMPFGSPEYVAPELLGSEVVDPRADLYSLGVTLFEAVAGKVPFRADSPLALVKLHEKQVPPDLAPYRLPEALESTILRALSKDPDDRFPTAAAMKAALEGAPQRALEVAAPNTCTKCGAAMVLGVPHCVECEYRPVKIGGRTRGGRRVVLDPGRRLGSDRDVLTFEQKAKLMQVLREMGGADNWKERSLDTRLKHPPAVVADRLSDADAERLATALAAEGLPTVVSWRGLPGWLMTIWRLRSSLLGFLAFYLFILGPILVIPLAMFVGPAIEELVATAYVIGLFGAGGVWALSTMARTSPLVTFDGAAGIERSDDPLALKTANVFSRIESDRLRNLLRRLFNRGFRLGSAPARRLLEEALVEAERIVDLEAEVEALDPHEIADRIQTLDERIDASADTYETNELIEEKHRLMASLARHDENGEERSRGYARLLELSATLAHLDDGAGSSEC